MYGYRVFYFITNPRYYRYDIYIRLVHTHRYLHTVFFRKAKELNQLKVAMDLNMSREALSHYENGKRNPDIQTLKLLSRYFNVSIDYLINGEEFKK